MEAKFLLKLPEDLRILIKREARKQGITMNEYIVTILEQFILLSRGKTGENAEGSRN